MGGIVQREARFQAEIPEEFFSPFHPDLKKAGVKKAGSPNLREEQSGWTNSRILSSRLSVRRSSGTASQQRPAANQDMGDGLIAAIFRQVLKLDSLVRASALTCSAGALLETPDQQSRNTGCNHTPHSQLTFSAALRILNSIDPNRADGRANKFRQELHSRSRVHTATIPSRGYPGARILGGG